MMPLDPFFVFLFFWTELLKKQETGFLFKPITEIEKFSIDLDNLLYTITNPTVVDVIKKTVKQSKMIKSISLRKFTSK